MQDAGVDALLVTHLPDVRYLCGFTGSNAVLAFTAGARGVQARLFTDGRYIAQAKREVHAASVRIVKGSATAHATAFVTNSTAKCCGFDATAVTVHGLAAMRATLSSKEAKQKRPASFLKPLAPLVGALRENKDEMELAKMTQAALLGCELYDDLLGWIQANMREMEVAAELEYRARKAGAEAMSFETIVASGVRSSMPHARATSARLQAGTLLTLDFGIILDGYCSDMTRTVFLSTSAKASSAGVAREQQRVFEAVLEAQQTAVATVREGVAMGTVDEAARSVLRKAGLAKYFTHSTGHGLGLEIHESPRIAARETRTLQAGMVITVEPGVYLPDRFGVRIEDTVSVTANGCEILTPAHRGWVEL